ncbi:labd-13Z-ene-9,15,16-triol synthase, chloroplastic-like [Aristolochia californica]|uniref:labd-13Z-ene-9,15,16-triol synthase, chloroplastic-like n=1 Tax=Aristolochia californica TaxID=171875 RepID=UPI0035E2E2EF
MKTFFAILFSLLLVLWILRRLMKNSSSLAGKLPPGPVPAPLVGILFKLGDEPHRSLPVFASTYGPLMSLWLGQVTTVVVSSAAMSKEVLQRNDQSFAGRSMVDAIRVLGYEGAVRKFTAVHQSALPSDDGGRHLTVEARTAASLGNVATTSYKGPLEDESSTTGVSVATTTNVTNQISSIPMLSGMNFKAWKDTVEIVLRCMDLDLTLRAEQPISTRDNLNVIKIEKWEHSNRMCLMIMKHSILEAIEQYFAKNEKSEASILLAKLVYMKYKGKGNIKEYY